MDVGSVSSSAAVQSQAQLGVLKKANDQQTDQAKQLLDAQAQAQAQVQAQDKAQSQRQQVQEARPGQPGNVINTYA